MLQRSCRIQLVDLVRRVVLHCSLLAGFCLKNIKMSTQKEEKMTVPLNSEELFVYYDFGCHRRL